MAAKKTVRVGISGMTSDHVWEMGDGLATLSEVVLVAGAEPHSDLRDLAADRWNLPQTYDSYQEMFEREDLDAVLVCSDNVAKAGIAEAAARRGVHVYQDKPMAATLEQADRILAAVEESGITLMVAYHSSFDPVYQDVRRLIHDGAIGSLHLARGFMGHSGPFEFGCSWHFCDWLFDPARNGGGCFIDEACYLISAFLDVVGPVVEVNAFFGVTGASPNLPPGVEENAVAILRFANGALGVLDTRWGQVGPAPVRTSYHGSGGTVLTSGNPLAPGTELFSTQDIVPPSGWGSSEIPEHVVHRSIELPIGLPPARGATRPRPAMRGWRAPERPSTAGSGGAEQRYFVELILAGATIEGAGSPRAARDTQEVIEAAYLAAVEGRSVRLPLAIE
jgi:predicted dehydrogenase